MDIQERVQLLKLDEVTALTNLSRSTIDRLEREGRFPRRRRISQRAVRWLAFEVDAWVRRGGAAEAA